MRAKLKSVWVRKLIGKLGVPYNRRLLVRSSPPPLYYETFYRILAANSNAFRIQSDLCSRDATIAACISLCSSGESLMLIIIPRNLDFGSFGLPIFVFIKYFVYSENNGDRTCIPLCIKSTSKTIWQTSLKPKRKWPWFPCWRSRRSLSPSWNCRP